MRIHSAYVVVLYVCKLAAVIVDNINRAILTVIFLVFLNNFLLLFNFSFIKFAALFYIIVILFIIVFGSKFTHLLNLFKQKIYSL